MNTKRNDKISIRVEPKTKAALDMFCAELSLETDTKVTLNDAIWTLVVQAKPHIRERIDEITNKKKPDDK